VLLLSLLTLASAGDYARTTLGADLVWSPAAAAGDLDLQLGHRSRWALSEGEPATQLHTDLWLTLDPGGAPALERARLTRLGTEMSAGPWVVDAGRHPVRYGGPRLVDGAQAIATLDNGLQLGGWAGLAPDLYTTLPRLRAGGGPVVAWTGPAVQGSVLGEVLFHPATGGLDRLATLAMGRATWDRWMDLSGRLDLDLVSADGGPHLADGNLLVVTRPTDTWRVDAFYEAFSSLRYLRTEALDPFLTRFGARLAQLGPQLEIVQDALDPTVNHLVGGAVQWRDRPGLGAQARASVDGRYRYHPNPQDRFARVRAEVGVAELEVAGALDLALDGALAQVDTGTQQDLGLLVLWEPGEARRVALDGSWRLLLAPAIYDGVGWYTDLFVDAVVAEHWLLVAGASVSREPDPDFDDVGVGAFTRATAVFR